MTRLDGIEDTRHLHSRLAELSALRLAAMSRTAANSFSTHHDVSNLRAWATSYRETRSRPERASEAGREGLSSRGPCRRGRLSGRRRIR
jgi:hypothetical protein